MRSASSSAAGAFPGVARYLFMISITSWLIDRLSRAALLPSAP